MTDADIRFGPQSVQQFFVKSEPRLCGVAPVTRTVMGSSKRVKTGRSRPLSKRNDNSIKSSARSLFDLIGRGGRGAPNVFIGGNVLSAIIAWLVVFEGVTGIQN